MSDEKQKRNEFSSTEIEDQILLRDDALRRFEREARTAGRLQHRNIVTIFDYGVLSTEGAFLVIELVRGESLRDCLERER